VSDASASTLILAQEATQGGLAGLFLPAVFLAVLYFLLIRPQSKRRKELARLSAGLTTGDLVATIGGIHGEVQDLDERTVDLAVTYDAQGRADVVIRFDRAAIVRVIEPAAGPAEGPAQD
jgi:preprotein translocase subunit YajC